MLNKILFNHHASHAEQEQRYVGATRVFGFWIYLMSDCVLFAALFATYAVLVNGTSDGPTGKDIFKLPYVMIETFLLLLSSTTYSLAMLFLNQKNKNQVIVWLSLTFLCGLIFTCMEINEFCDMIKKGFGPNRSAFLSSLFILLATHGVHIASGLIWILVMIAQVLYRGLTILNKSRLQSLSLFWHFLDIIWICIFTIVYLVEEL